MPLTKLNNKAVANVTTLPVSLGDMVLVSSATASSSASIEFTLGSYKEYQFYWVNCHPATDGVQWEFQCSIDNGSNYGVTMTSTKFRAAHTESDSYAALTYESFQDLAQSTNFHNLHNGQGNENDEACSGMLSLFNPSSTTFVKHFIARGCLYQNDSYPQDEYSAGYFNNTNNLTNIKFRFSSGNIDAGKILCFGIN